MTPFVVFGFATQILLVAFFASVRWRPPLQPMLGRLVYGVGVVGAVLAFAMVADGQTPELAIGPALYAAWALFGAFIDIIRPIEWRRPLRLSVLAPYVTLMLAATFGLWIPLWYIGAPLWIAFGVLFAAHTAINISTHAQPREGRPSGVSRS